ncbi:MAG: hypothetical protein ACE14S_04275 [Candidatus Bathyarchaeia archaeon]
MAHVQSNVASLRRRIEEKAFTLSVLSLVASLIVSVASLVVTGYYTNENLKLTNENVKLQGALYDFAPQIVWVNENTAFNFKVDVPKQGVTSGESIGLVGVINQKLKIVTPHFGLVNVTAKELILNSNSFTTYGRVITIERLHDYSISYAEPPFEDAVGQGLNQVNATLWLTLSVFLRVTSSNDMTPIGFPLGDLILEASFLDLQKDSRYTSEFKVTIRADLLFG